MLIQTRRSDVVLLEFQDKLTRSVARIQFTEAPGQNILLVCIV